MGGYFSVYGLLQIILIGDAMWIVNLSDCRCSSQFHTYEKSPFQISVAFYWLYSPIVAANALSQPPCLRQHTNRFLNTSVGAYYILLESVSPKQDAEVDSKRDSSHAAYPYEYPNKTVSLACNKKNQTLMAICCSSIATAHSYGPHSRCGHFC
jgi:hypothetical protein